MITTAARAQLEAARRAKADADAAKLAWRDNRDPQLEPVLLAQFLAADTVFAVLEPLLKEDKR
jgi:hypothetical protein